MMNLLHDTNEAARIEFGANRPWPVRAFITPVETFNAASASPALASA
tara:strand:- start:78240 stop:78380 length:141 start_codon:yes stop_codon:yes gene_type:complete